MKEKIKPSRLLLLSSVILALLFAQNVLHAQAPGKIPPPTKSPSLPVPSVIPTPQLPPAPSEFLYTADTNEVAKKQGVLKLGNFSWGCQGLRCTAKSTAPTPDVAGCKALAEQIGQIKSYGHPAKQLSAEELKQCNAGIALAAGPNVQPVNPGTVPQVGQTQKPQQSSGQQQGGSDPNQPAKTPAGQSSPSQQSSGQQQSGSQPNQAGKTPAGATPAGSSPAGTTAGFTPIRISTARLSYNGLGSSGGPAPFAPVRHRTGGLAYTGLGGASGPPIFTPVRLRTGTLTYTGTGGP